MRNSAEIQLIGYVYQDPKCPNEAQYPNWVVFKMCVKNKYKDKNNIEQESISWYECKSSSEKLSKIIKSYVKDKQGILVKGLPKAKAYIANDGSAQGSIEVLVTDINILTYPKEEKLVEKYDTPNDNGRFKVGGNSKAESAYENILHEDDIPF